MNNSNSNSLEGTLGFDYSKIESPFKRSDKLNGSAYGFQTTTMTRPLKLDHNTPMASDRGVEIGPTMEVQINKPPNISTFEKNDKKKVATKPKAIDLMLALKTERKRQMELSKKLSEV